MDHNRVKSFLQNDFAFLPDISTIFGFIVFIALCYFTNSMRHGAYQLKYSIKRYFNPWQSTQHNKFANFKGSLNFLLVYWVSENK